MIIRQKKKGGAVVCYIDGPVDITTIFRVKKVFKDILETKPQKLVLNFEKVEYIDSLGLAALIGLLKRLQEIDGRMVLTNISPKVSTIFKVTKVDTAFKTFATEEEALAAF